MYYIEKLNILRVSKNISVRELSLRCELLESSVKKILSKKCAPLVPSLSKICTVLEVSLSELFCASDEMVMKNSPENIALISAYIRLPVEAKSHLLWIAQNIKS